jgi:hypothetical protein
LTDTRTSWEAYTDRSRLGTPERGVVRRARFGVRNATSQLNLSLSNRANVTGHGTRFRADDRVEAYVLPAFSLTLLPLLGR